MQIIFLSWDLLYQREDNNNDAIEYLEQALHLYAAIDFHRENVCARLLVTVL